MQATETTELPKGAQFARKVRATGENLRHAGRVGMKVLPTAMKLTKSTSKIGKSLAFVSKKAPLLGTLVTVGTAAAEIGGNLKDGELGKAFGATTAGVAEGLGNLAGFGVGDAAREAVRALTPERYRAEKSGIGELVTLAGEFGKTKKTDEITGPQVPAASVIKSSGPLPS